MLVLWESRTVCSCHIHILPNSICPLPYLPNFVGFFFLTHVWLVLPIYWMCSLPLKHGQLISNHNLKKTDSVSPSNYQWPITPQLGGGVALCLLLLIHLAIWLGLRSHKMCACHHSSCEFIGLCCVGRHWVFEIIHCQGSYTVSTPFSTMIPEPREKRVRCRCAI